jgi:hypothetical protein
MTRAQLYAIAALSLTSTTVVLAGGGGDESSAAVREALARAAMAARPAPVVASAPVVAATPPPVPAVAPTPTPAPAAPSANTASPAPTPRPAKPRAKPPAAPKPSKIGHVFVIALTGSGVDQTFAPSSPATYLVQRLRPRGTLLDNYVPLGSADLPNYLAFAGGRAPTPEMQSECPTYSDVAHQTGCVLPNTELSLADQITASGRSWRAYEEDMASGPTGVQTCRHPDSGAADDTLHGRPGDGYATRHNPFVYFHSLLDLGDCLANDVALDQFGKDLGALRTTPNLAFIAPNLCNDGTETPCADGSPGGLAATDAFLAQWVPQILRSKAYRHDGLLMIAFLSGPPGADAAVAPPRTGVLLLSRYAKPGATIDTPYDAFGLLRSVEDLFALDPLAKAGSATSFVKPALAAAVPAG